MNRDLYAGIQMLINTGVAALFYYFGDVTWWHAPVAASSYLIAIGVWRDLK
jgi:hypothetical protein